MGAIRKILDIERTSPEFQPIVDAMAKSIMDKEHETKLALSCFLASGHLLIEDFPGMGKTTFAKTLANSLGLRLSRIQFTNDLLPADILGTNVFTKTTGTFNFVKGPIFSEIVLGDELNRATPKTQSAFLEAMEERQISMDGQVYPLPYPFFLIATQNPDQQIGTFPLPESQLDRFMMRIKIGYPSSAAEKQMLKQGMRQKNTIAAPVLNRESVQKFIKRVDEINVSDHIVEYVQLILTESREKKLTSSQGFSPRSGLLLLDAAKSWAMINGRSFVLPEDIKAIAPSCLNHRLQLHDSLRDPWQAVHDLLERVPVPK
jgi:MoxR-like ATPase